VRGILGEGWPGGPCTKAHVRAVGRSPTAPAGLGVNIRWGTTFTRSRRRLVTTSARWSPSTTRHFPPSHRWP